MATEPQLAFQKAALDELAAAVERGNGLSAWSGGGLVAAYAGDGALAPRTEGTALWARRLAAATAVMVYFPLVLTWSGLGLATYAYHRARQDPAARLRGSFLEMWQQGFAGHLPGLLRFDQLVWYTITLLGLVVTLTLTWRSVQHRADEQDRRLLRRLARALARVESAAVTAAHTQPREFTEELQAAAAEMRALLQLSDSAGKLSRNLLREAVTASTAAVSATRVMDASAAALREAVASIAASSQEAAAAAERLTRGATDFGEAVQASTTTLTAGMVAAGEQAARHIVEAVATASGRFAETVARATAGQEAQAARRATEAHAVLTEGRDALTSAALELRESASGLGRSLAVLPDAIEEAAGTGADHIGLAYETAVTALAASLQGEVRRTGEVLAAQTADALARQEAAHRAAQERQLASEQRLLASAADSRTVLVSLLQRIEEHITRLEELERHEETVRVRTQQDRQLRASALRKELDLLDQLRERQERLLDVWTDHRSPDTEADTAMPDAHPGRQP